MTNPLEIQSNSPFEIAKQAADQIREATGVETHDIALTLGSGWAKAADLIGEEVASVPAKDIIGFSAPVVEATGAKTMILTNGCGGLKETWKPGTPVLISDHINLTASSPLEGPTFIDLTDLYSKRLRDLARTVDASLDEGVYAQFTGPHYETPAEVQMVKAMGGHLVGMSTALEAIAARQAGMEILGFSLMTNLAAGIQKTPLSHAEVLEAGREAEPRISALLASIIQKI
jgi:purine-nucleoside phosphorylase